MTEHEQLPYIYTNTKQYEYYNHHKFNMSSITFNIKYNNNFKVLIKKKYHNEIESIVGTINNITINDLYKSAFVEYTNNIDNTKVFFICNNKIIYKNTTILEILDILDKQELEPQELEPHELEPQELEIDNNNIYKKNYNIECFANLNGGDWFTDMLDMFTMPFEIILEPIFGPLIIIAKVFIFLIQLIFWFIKFVIWFVFFVAWIFTDLLNPVKLVTDFGNSLILIIVTIVSTIFNVLLGLMAFVINGVGGWMQGFWGWDQSSLTKKDINSNYFKSIDRNKGKKCYLTNNNTVPFSILLGTILCPPIGVFMNLGITGWFNILICGLLTLLYYIPGLFYALLVIYA